MSASSGEHVPATEREDEVLYRVTQEVIVSAPSGDFVAAGERGQELFRLDLAVPRTVKAHNFLAAHHSRLTIERADRD